MTKTFRLENGLLKIGEIANEAGVRESTIRYYTNIGILSVSETTDTGYRLYDRDETLRRLQAIKEINSGKLTLSQIATQLA
jgi:DNA-binding transcriptional MerR regulator